jgi:putative transposase
MRGHDHGHQFQGSPFSHRDHSHGVRWYLAYPLSTHHVEELMAERGVGLDHATINRWVIQYRPLLEEALHRRKRPVWMSWRLDETYIRVKGDWKYLYRAVDKFGKTIDFLLTAHRDEQAAKTFLTKAIRRYGGVPETIAIDGSAANEAAIKSDNAEHGTAIIIRKAKYLNNIIEQDHRAVKRVTRPMLGFKTFDVVQATLTGIELMHMLRKQPLAGGKEAGRTAAEQFYALAASEALCQRETCLMVPIHQNLRHSLGVSVHRFCSAIVAAL